MSRTGALAGVAGLVVLAIVIVTLAQEFTGGPGWDWRNW